MLGFLVRRLPREFKKALLEVLDHERSDTSFVDYFLENPQLAVRIIEQLPLFWCSYGYLYTYSRNLGKLTTFVPGYESKNTATLNKQIEELKRNGWRQIPDPYR